MTAAGKGTPSPSRSASAAYVAPFVAYIAFLGADRFIAWPLAVGYPVRIVVTLALVLWFSRSVLDLRFRQPLGSALMGVAVFLVWVGPDVLWPNYRHFWLFQNGITGTVSSSVPVGLRSSTWFLILRTAGSALLVPVVEELFWRGWLMRWLVDNDFRSVKPGTYSATSFWMVAVLFASEHGPFWDVGLAAGIAYNWWMLRTRSLADCILAHAVTNACLAWFVIQQGRWGYW